MFHIFCTFVSQSRAFLSQLSVTGDESVFFMRVSKDTIISFPINFFASVFFESHYFSSISQRYMCKLQKAPAE